jgi:phosphatidylglycerophosphate synthase
MSEGAAILRRLNDWNAALALLALGLSLGLRSALPSAVVGLASLFTFYAVCRPRERHLAGLGLANTLTLLRILIVFAVSLVFWRDPPFFAAGAAAVLILDGIDGWMARRFGEASAFGAYFDMEADAYLILMLCLVLYDAGYLGAWVLLPGALRYAFVALRRLQGTKPMRERRSQFGRVAFLTLAVSLILACLPPLRTISAALVGVGWVAVFISFSPDFRELIQGIRPDVERG